MFKRKIFLFLIVCIPLKVTADKNEALTEGNLDDSFHTAYSSIEERDPLEEHQNNLSYEPFLQQESEGDDSLKDFSTHSYEQTEKNFEGEDFLFSQGAQELNEQIMIESQKRGFWKDPLFRARIGIIMSLVGSHILLQWISDHHESLSDFLDSLYADGSQIFDAFILWAQDMWGHLPNLENLQDLITSLPMKIWEKIPSKENLLAQGLKKWEDSSGQVIYNLWNSPEKMGKAQHILSKITDTAKNLSNKAWSATKKVWS
jgi:hypothetical protein